MSAFTEGGKWTDIRRHLAALPDEKLDALNAHVWSKCKTWMVIATVLFVLGVWVDFRWLLMIPIPLAFLSVRLLVMSVVKEEMDRRRG